MTILRESFDDVGEAAREILAHPQEASGRWRRPEIVLLAAEVALVAQALDPPLGERGPGECVHLGGGLCDCGWPHVDCPHNRYADAVRT